MGSFAIAFLFELQREQDCRNEGQAESPGGTDDRELAFAGCTKVVTVKRPGMIPGLNCFKMSGPEGVRTPDLMTASHARSQLRHRPVRNNIQS